MRKRKWRTTQLWAVSPPAKNRCWIFRGEIVTKLLAPRYLFSHSKLRPGFQIRPLNIANFGGISQYTQQARRNSPPRFYYAPPYPSEAAGAPLSRSIVSVIARLIKPFMLSLWASAWALIISFFPFGIAIDTRSRFATSHFLLPALRASVYFCEDIHITPLRFILLYLLKQHLTSEHFAHILTWLFVYIANWIHLLSALKWMTRSEEKRI